MGGSLNRVYHTQRVAANTHTQTHFRHFYHNIDFYHYFGTQRIISAPSKNGGTLFVLILVSIVCIKCLMALNDEMVECRDILDHRGCKYLLSPQNVSVLTSKFS